MLSSFIVVYIDAVLFISYIEIVAFILFTGLKSRRIVKICSSVRNVCVTALKVANVCINPSESLFMHFDMVNCYEPQNIQFTLEYLHPYPLYPHPLYPYPLHSSSGLLRVDEDAREDSEFIYDLKDQWHILQDVSGQMHIGLVIEAFDSRDSVVFCLDLLTHPNAFFHFPMQTAKSHLIELIDDGEDDIRAADFGHTIRIEGLYDLPETMLIMKTHCICTIQRKWKQIYCERLRKARLRGKINAQRQFELTGKYYL